MKKTTKKTKLGALQLQIKELEKDLKKNDPTPIEKKLIQEKLKSLQLLEELRITAKEIILESKISKKSPKLIALENRFVDIYILHYRQLPENVISTILNKRKVKKRIQQIKKDQPKFWKSIKPKIEKYSSTKTLIEFKDSVSVSHYDVFWDIFTGLTTKYIENIKEFTQTDQKKFISYRKINSILNKVLNNIEKDLGYKTKWKTVYQTNPKIKTFIVNHTRQIIKIPQVQRKLINIKGLVFHEILIHVLRSENAKKFGLMSRLPDYKIFEEGFAKTVQQIAQKEPKIVLQQITQPLIIVLNEVGLTMDEIKKFLRYSKHKNTQKQLQRAHRRTLKKRYKLENIKKEILHYHDLSYGIGAINFYYLIKKMNQEDSDSPLRKVIYKILSIILVCKFDPLNPDHILYLLEKDILILEPEEKQSYFDMITSEEFNELRIIQPIV